MTQTQAEFNAQRAKILAAAPKSKLGMAGGQMPAYKPAEDTVAPVAPIVAPPEAPPTYLDDVGHAAAGSWASGVAGAQRTATKLGLGDWKEEEKANWLKSQQEAAQVSPERQQAMARQSFDDSGFHGLNLPGMGLEVAKGISNLGTVTGLAGGFMQKANNPLVKAAGIGLGSVAGAMSMGGDAAHNVELAGGDEAAQNKAMALTGGLGLLTGGAGVLADAKIMGMITGEAAQAVKLGAAQAAKAGTPGAAEAYAKILADEVAEKAAYKALNPLTKAGVIAKKGGTIALTAGTLESGQEMPESGGQTAAENIALGKPWSEGVLPSTMMGGAVGFFSGGLMAGTGQVAHGTFTALKPEIAPGTHSTVGEDRQTNQFVVPGMSGKLPANLDTSSIATKLNTTAATELDTGSTAVSVPGSSAVLASTEGTKDIVDHASKAEEITGDLNAGLHTTSLMDVGAEQRQSGDDLANRMAEEQAVAPKSLLKANYMGSGVGAPAEATSLPTDTSPFAKRVGAEDTRPVPLERRDQPMTPERITSYDNAEKAIIAANDDLKLKDPGTVMHQQVVTKIATALGKVLGLKEDQTRRLSIAALGHDLGKRYMEKLLHEENLTDAQFEELKTHPAKTEARLRELGVSEDIIKTAMEHHMHADNAYKEADKATGFRGDGGYPFHKDFPDITSQILAVADIFDSLIGGPGSGHEYALRGGDKTRTTHNIIALLRGDAKAGRINKVIAERAIEMVANGELPEAQMNELRINDAKFEDEKGRAAVAAWDNTDTEPTVFQGFAGPLQTKTPVSLFRDAATEVTPTPLTKPVIESIDEGAPRNIATKTGSEPIQEIITGDHDINGEPIKMPAPREIPPAGTHVVGADSYYIDKDKKPVGKYADAASSTKAGEKDSITLRAVSKLHSLIAGEEGTAEHLGGNKYKVGEETYTLNRRGDNFEVIPDKGLSDTHDVTIERIGNKLYIRVDDFTKERGTTTDTAKHSRTLRAGVASAKTLIKNDPQGKTQAKNTIVVFKGDKGGVPVTVSALRTLGASLNGQGNETLAQILENVKEGMAYAIANIGGVVPRLSSKGTAKIQGMTGRTQHEAALDLMTKNLIVSDRYGPVTGEGSKLDIGERPDDRIINQMLKNAPKPLILADGSQATGPVTFGQVQEILDLGNKASTRAQNRADSAQTILDGLKLLKSTKEVAMENSQNPKVMALIAELQGMRQGNKRFNAIDWLTIVRNTATKAANNVSGTDADLVAVGDANKEVAQSVKETALNAAEAIKAMLPGITAETTVDDLAAMYKELDSKAGTDMPAPEGKVIKVRGNKMALHSLPILRNLLGEMRVDPSINPLTWMREQLGYAQKDAGSVSGKEMSSIDDISEQVMEPSEKDVWTESPKQSSVKPYEKVLPQQQLKNFATSPVFTPRVINYLNGLTAKLGILTSFSLHDSASMDSLPDAAKDLISQYPGNSVFIALDDGTGKNEHIIYIAQTNPDGTSRSKKAQAIDLAHEYGHFVQRSALDFIIRSAMAEGADPSSKALLADILGVPYEEGQDPMAAFQALTAKQVDMIEENFANNLAFEMIRAMQGDSMAVNNATFLDAVGAKNKAGFLVSLGRLLVKMFNDFYATFATGKKPTQVSRKDFRDFLDALTNRTHSIEYPRYATDALKAQYPTLTNVQVENKYTELAKMRTSSKNIPSRKTGNIVQYMENPMQRASQWDKLNKLFTPSERNGERILDFIHKFYSTDRELEAMDSNFSTWLRRSLYGATGDVGSHKENLIKLKQEYTGYLNGMAVPVLNAQPKYDYLFGKDQAAEDFRAAVFHFQVRNVPTADIPGNLNFVVKETIDGRKNVTMNVRDNIALLREFDDKGLYDFTTAEGLKMNKKPEHFAFKLSGEQILKNPDQVMEALMYTGDVDIGDGITPNLVHHEGRTKEEARNFIDFYQNGENLDSNPFGPSLEAAPSSETFNISVRAPIAGSTNDATKAQKLTQAERILLSGFAEADPASLIVTRISQAVKARALDHLFGSWVIPGANKNDFALLSRESHTAFVAKQHSLAGDAIVEMWGYPDATDANINELFKAGDKKAAYSLLNQRKAIIEDVKNTDNLETQHLRGREILDAVEAFIGRSYYSPMARIDAGLQKAQADSSLSLKQIIRIQDVIMPALLGRLGAKEMTAGWRATSSYMMTAMNVIYLPLAVLSSFAEPVQIGTRLSDPILSKGAWASQAATLTAMGKMLFKPDGGVLYEQADNYTRSMGLVVDSAMENALSASSESEFMAPGVRQFNSKFFEITMLKWFTDFVRRVAYAIGKEAVYDYAVIAESGDPMRAEQAKAMAAVLNLDTAAAVKLSREDWVKTDNARRAIATWSEEATLRPSASTRPAFGSDARLGLLWYLKDFPWAMHAKTLTYLAQQSKLQPTVLAKTAPWIAAAIPMMIAGALGGYARDLLTNQLPSALMGIEPTDRYANSWMVMSAAATKSGLMGPYELLFQTMQDSSRRGNMFVGLGGPVASILQSWSQKGGFATAADKVPLLSVLAKDPRQHLQEMMGLRQPTE